MHIFATRLERLADKIFQGRGEKERQLYRKFSKCVPRSFSKVLMAHDRDMFASGKEMNWVYVKNLAAAQDRFAKSQSGNFLDEDRKNKKLVIDMDPEVYIQRNDGEYEGRFIRGKEVGINRNNNKQEPGRGVSHCDWCGRVGHAPLNCWVKLGLCELCGAHDHKKETCSKYDLRWKNFKPKCPRCFGGHLGRDCPNHLNE